MVYCSKLNYLTGILIIYIKLYYKYYQTFKNIFTKGGSVVVTIFKDREDIQECSNYRGIILMSHSIKI